MRGSIPPCSSALIAGRFPQVAAAQQQLADTCVYMDPPHGCHANPAFALRLYCPLGSYSGRRSTDGWMAGWVKRASPDP